MFIPNEVKENKAKVEVEVKGVKNFFHSSIAKLDSHSSTFTVYSFIWTEPTEAAYY